MATIDELEQQKLAGGAGGSVLAGNGGAAQAGTGQSNTGSGFTNLQKYLSANQGQGAGLADAMIGQGQQAVDAQNKVANENADTWATGQIKGIEANAGQVAGGYNTAAEGVRATQTEAQDPSNLTFDNKGAADRDGYNDLDAAYQKAKTVGNEYAGDYGTQKAGLQNKFGYGSGFGALDTFLGRQDGKEKIQGWQNGIQVGNAGAQAGQVNAAVAKGQGQIDTAKAGFGQANQEVQAAGQAKAAATKAAADSAAAQTAAQAKLEEDNRYNDYYRDINGNLYRKPQAPNTKTPKQNVGD